MAKQAIDTYADLRNAGRINARIIDARSGLQTLEGIFAVRIHSKGFRVGLTPLREYPRLL